MLSPSSDGLSFFSECLRSFRRFKRSVGSLADDRVEFLSWVQRRLRRARCYRMVLGCSERGALELTLSLAKRGLVKVVSRELLNAIGLILMRVKGAALRFCDVLAEEGRAKLVDVCRVAASWGNCDALMWLRDRGFAIYLALVKRSSEALWAAG
jgi:hypothetical protein